MSRRAGNVAVQSILGAHPDPIPLAKVSFDARAEAYVLAAIRSGRVSQGPLVEALEESVAAIVGVRHAVAMSNGTLSLIAALHVLGIGPGDEVITTPFTFVATLNAILAVGATPRFADIDETDFNMRADCVEALINAKTRAVMPVHLFGHPADMTAICEVADRAQIAVIEDAAQSLGALHRGRPVGSFGVGSFSLYATKNVTTAEGGVITTNDDAIARSLRALRNQGLDDDRTPLAFGLNLRLSDLHAGLGLPQLGDVEDIIHRRSANACAISDGLDGVDGLIPPAVRAGDRHVFHQYTLRLDADSSIGRDDLAADLARSGIGSGVYYRTLTCDAPQVRDRSGRIDECPTARAMSEQVLSIPVHQHLSDQHVERIISAVRRAVT